MGVLSFMESYPEETINCPVYLSYILLGLLVLHGISRSGRPVAHPDRKLGSKHKAAEAERVEILERLNSGSKVGDAQFQGGEHSRLPSAGLSDVEKEPLCTPLLQTSSEEASEATITLSLNGARLTSNVVESMKNASKAAARGEVVDDSVVYNPERTMLQTKVDLRDGIFERLKDIVHSKTSTTSPSEKSMPALQVDNWAMLKPSDQGVDLHRLPLDEVPVILHAEYAAGLLTITGLNLEDASILISAKNAYHTVRLKVLRFLKATKGKHCRRQACGRFSDTEEDIVILPTRLSWKEMDDVFVYATKKVQTGVDGQSVDTVSKAVPVTDSVFKTVFGLWIPCVAVWIFVIYNVKALLRAIPLIPLGDRLSSILTGVIGPSGFFYLVCVLALCGNPSSRFTEFIKYHVETIVRGLGQALLIVYYGFKSLKGPHLKFYSSDVRRGALAPPPVTVKPPPPTTSGVRSKAPLDSVSLNSSEKSAVVKSVDDPDWEWPAFDQFEGKKGKIELKRLSEIVRDDASPFRVLYRRRKEQLWPDLVQVDLLSTHLIKVVQKVLPQNGDLQSLANPKVQGRDLFTVLDELKNHNIPGNSADNSNENPQAVGEAGFKDECKGGLDLKHLLRFMEKEYSDVFVRHRRMTEEKRVAWDMLWTFLTPGKKVVYTCDHTQEVLAAVVSKNSYSMNSYPGMTEGAFTVDLDVWDYDGRSYHKCQLQRMISKFDGEVAFSSLLVRPIELESVPENLDEGFLANGKRFYELAVKNSHRFMHYSGSIFQLNRTDGFMRIVKQNADGRVMIDLASFAKMNPGYKMGNAKPPVGTFRGLVDDRPGRRIRFEEQGGILDLAHPSSLIVADETLVFAPAVVYGFSFTLKQWGSFSVSGFSEICFNTNAYDTLVMEPDSKQLVHKLVRQYIGPPGVGPSETLQMVDPIANKGEGCIFLCYGPPGTGKTLTAESVAESMHRPLWSLTASELGATANSLEKTLVEVLDIAATWRAVLLLDEADVFLERRTSSATHGAMTGVFLRFLEYYRGVLFLTTNRIGTFDNAFRSRISMFLRYPKLSAQQKEQIWIMLLARAGVAGITPELVSEVAAEELNGREIRNVIHTAQILAKSNGETLDQNHVRHVTGVVVSSLKTLSDTMKIYKGNET